MVILEEGRWGDVGEGRLTYILQRSPRWPCRRSQSGLSPVERTRRSGAWDRGTPWTRRILHEVVSHGALCDGSRHAVVRFCGCLYRRMHPQP